MLIDGGVTATMMLEMPKKSVEETERSMWLRLRLRVCEGVAGAWSLVVEEPERRGESEEEGRGEQEDLKGEEGSGWKWNKGHKHYKGALNTDTLKVPSTLYVGYTSVFDPDRKSLILDQTGRKTETSVFWGPRTGLNQISPGSVRFGPASLWSGPIRDRILHTPRSTYSVLVVKEKVLCYWNVLYLKMFSTEKKNSQPHGANIDTTLSFYLHWYVWLRE